MNDVELHHVSKRYWVPAFHAAPREQFALRRYIAGARAHREAHWALDDVTLAVKGNETVGLIGPNGAGKSTLFKLLAGITTPTSGEIRTRGRLAALIEIGSGFHPELTGRENVFLSGAILGMRRREIARKLDEIVDFAGVASFIDVPVKWYSSGMYVRLGFSIAAHLPADILLVDEAISVGDEAFQRQCYGRITALRAAGATVVFISHDLTAVERLCDRAILLRAGRVEMDGAARDVASAYRGSVAVDRAPDADAGLPHPVTLLRLDFAQADHQPPRTGFPLIARLSFVATHRIADALVELSYYTHNGRVLHCQQTTALTNTPLTLEAGPGIIEFESPSLGLQPGEYSVVARAATTAGQALHRLEVSGALVVEPGKMVGGYFYMPHSSRLVGRRLQGGQAELTAGLRR